jgi:hypothetical protein
MGQAGRSFIEKNHTIDAFVASVKQTVDQVLEERMSRQNR